MCWFTPSFLFNWLDLLAFSLSGMEADSTSCAAMAYVMADLHREGAKLGKFLYSRTDVAHAGAMACHNSSLAIDSTLVSV